MVQVACIEAEEHHLDYSNILPIPVLLRVIGWQTATAIREAVYTGSYLGLCPVLKHYLDKKRLLEGYPPGSSLVAAGISAGLFAAFATQPFDTAKTRMQAFLNTKVCQDLIITKTE
jgi:hypothetical protein